MRTLGRHSGLGVAAILAIVTALLPLAVTPPASASPAAPAASAAPVIPQAISTPPANDVLAGVSCTGPAFCVAVGSYTRPLGSQRALAELWNGTSWRVASGISGAPLRGVSCTSRSFCMAVGPGVTGGPGVADRWNGRTWSRLSMPSADHLLTVSCTRSSFCMGVGGGSVCSSGAVWNGVRWRDLPMPEPCGPSNGPLEHISCTSTTYCLAVGDYAPNNEDQLTLVDEWNGHAWKQLNAPSPGVGSSDLTGVSCPSTAFCMALGGMVVETVPPQCPLPSGSTCGLVLTWNGSTWQQLTAPRAGLSAVSCPTTTRCIAVGQNLASLWNGSTWQDLTVPQPGEKGMALQDVWCWSAFACMAVGSFTTLDGAQLTLALQWNGSGWRVRRTPNPDAAPFGLSAVSCRAGSACIAVGSRISAADVQRTLAKQRSARGWKTLPTPNPTAQASALTGVSCPATTGCIAVGYYDSSGVRQALALRWDGVSWHELSLSQAGMLTSVSCPAPNSCEAVGSAPGGPGKQAPLALAWNGSTWTQQTVTPPHGVLGVLSSVSCSAATRCVAVGYFRQWSGGSVHAIAQAWNGTSWQGLPAPKPGFPAELDGVSCSRATRCMAVGSYLRSGSGHPVPIRALAETWNGSAWQLTPTGHRTGQTGGHLAAVSCTSPRSCRAVGGFTGTSGKEFVLAESWNGTTWQFMPIGSPSPTFNDLYGISCTGPSPCTAVGETGAQLPLSYAWNGSTWKVIPTTP